jgi:hypothetical protein
MKRISLFAIVILTIAPGVTKAYIYDYGYGSFRYRTHWSPYAFSHKRSGLVSGDLRYSPYAFSHKNPSGLVDRDFRYSPYAFSHKNPSGLIHENAGYSPYAFSYKHSGFVADAGYRACYRTCCAPVMVVHSVHNWPCTVSCKHSESSDQTKNSYEEKLMARRERIKKARDSRKQINMAKKNDGKEIIYRYLKSRNINDFEITGILKINNKTVNVNFLLRDKNIIITYWDLDEVQSLLQQPGYRRNYYERHEQQWKNLCTKYIQTGGKVYPITSADAKEILAKLMLCPELNDG